MSHNLPCMCYMRSLLSGTLLVQVDAEMSRGALPGLLSIAAKLGPATQRVVARTRESLQNFEWKVSEPWAWHAVSVAATSQTWTLSEAAGVGHTPKWFGYGLSAVCHQTARMPGDAAGSRLMGVAASCNC
jgi:hypothetical protein